MVGVFLKYYITDTRQKEFKVFPKKSKFSNYTTLQDPYIVWKQPKPLETVMLLDQIKNIRFYTSTTAPANYLHVNITNPQHYWFYLYLRLNSARVYTPLDMSYIPALKSSCTVASCYLTNFSVVTHTRQAVISSISTIFSSFNWVEREVREFSNTHFYGLRDTRRLLSDYTVQNVDYDGYKTLSYENVTQNLYFTN